MDRTKFLGALVALLGFPALCTASPPNRKPAECALTLLASVAVVADDGVRIPVQVHGQTLWMMLDLGQPLTFLAPSAVDALHLKAESFSTRDEILRSGDKRVTQTAKLDELRIGDYALARRDFFVDPGAHGDSAVKDGVIGWLGMGDLWRVDFEIDLAHKRFSLYSHDNCDKPAPYWSQHYARTAMAVNELGNVYFPLEVNGSIIEAGISTTTAQTYIRPEALRMTLGLDEHSPSIESIPDVSGRQHLYFRAATVTSGNLKFSDVRIFLAPPVKGCTLSPTGMFGDVPEYKGRDQFLCFGVYPMVLGTEAIEHLRIYFATREKALYFQSSDYDEKVAHQNGNARKSGSTHVRLATTENNSGRDQ
jgi:hypothetical protein